MAVADEQKPGEFHPTYLCPKWDTPCEWPSCDVPVDPAPQHDCKYRDNTLPDIPPDA